VSFNPCLQEQVKPEIYQKFIQTLKRNEHQEINFDQMTQIIEDILKPYPDLTEKFIIFNKNEKVTPLSQLNSD
jgi:histone deacetylase complex regulatory component SIN3